MKGVNGGNDFDQDMLNDIFEAIRYDLCFDVAEHCISLHANFVH